MVKATFTVELEGSEDVQGVKECLGMVMDRLGPTRFTNVHIEGVRYRDVQMEMGWADRIIEEGREFARRIQGMKR